MKFELPDALPITEQENSRTSNLSSLSVAEIVRLMNEEDALISAAVAKVLPQVEKAVAGIVKKLRGDGRLFYIGTGTSGRLGILDASECPPTFGVSLDLVQGVIAGGYEACYRAVEASEDDAQAAQRDLETRGFVKDDVLVGIAASGRTPYTIGAVTYAGSLGAFTVAVTCAPDSPITRVAEVSIVPVVGPEVVTGSTRLKAGTAQKMVLNMLSTATLVKLGYVSGNRMSNLQARNSKLRARAVRILMAETDLNENAAAAALVAGSSDIRIALVMTKTGCNAEAAKKALAESSGIVHQAINELGGPT
ncbi:MAG: N-acetylmuramic acid 6-phosphate etherase [Pyrinomonadaceae bacterium]|nr:N-acetylmuramic acid 6-phosphate etherase [Pyrinomonadaceae bacterium]MDQ3173102.1 N-acetylmuramic acid 6-phosphate etherase [Acidobacteriota bacterium]